MDKNVCADRLALDSPLQRMLDPRSLGVCSRRSRGASIQLFGIHSSDLCNIVVSVHVLIPNTGSPDSQHERQVLYSLQLIKCVSSL